MRSDNNKTDQNLYPTRPVATMFVNRRGMKTPSWEMEVPLPAPVFTMPSVIVIEVTKREAVKKG